MSDLSPYELQQFKDMAPEEIEEDFQHFLSRSRSAAYTPRSPATSPRRRSSGVLGAGWTGGARSAESAGTRRRSQSEELGGLLPR